VPTPHVPSPRVWAPICQLISSSPTTKILPILHQHRPSIVHSILVFIFCAGAEFILHGTERRHRRAVEDMMLLRPCPRGPPATVLIVLALFLAFSGPLQGSAAAAASARVHHAEGRPAVAAGAAQKPLDHSPSGGEDAGTRHRLLVVLFLAVICPLLSLSSTGI